LFNVLYPSKYLSILRYYKSFSEKVKKNPFQGRKQEKSVIRIMRRKDSTIFLNFQENIKLKGIKMKKGICPVCSQDMFVLLTNAINLKGWQRYFLLFPHF